MSEATEFVKHWLDAVNRGDLDALVRMCHPDVELSNPDGTFRGADGVRALFKAIIDATSERESQVTNVIDSDGSVVVEFVFRAKNTGPFATPQSAIPATLKRFELPTIGIYELRDGKLAASRGLYDRLTLLSQLGLAGARPPA